MRTLITSILLVLSFQAASVSAENTDKTFEFKKGQAVDVLFLQTKPDTSEKLKEYFATVFPLIKDAGYQPMPGFRIAQKPTQGNYHPSVLALAAWRDGASRAQAMERIDANVPDFHERRLDIWSSFAMTVYEMDRDLSFVIDSEGTYVLTAYWGKDGKRSDAKAFEAFKKEWLEKSKSSGGQLTLELEGGFSPFGYRYDPDHLTITRWQSPEAFEAFHKENLAMDHEGVEHVNQFILETVPDQKK